MVEVVFFQHLPTGTDWEEEAFSNSSALAATLEQQRKQKSSRLLTVLRLKISSWKSLKPRNINNKTQLILIYHSL